MKHLATIATLGLLSGAVVFSALSLFLGAGQLAEAQRILKEAGAKQLSPV
jgi:hypothetical protein